MKGLNCQIVLHITMCASKFSASVIQVFQVGVQFVDKFVDKNGKVNLRDCEVSIQRVVSDGCRVRPSWPSVII